MPGKVTVAVVLLTVILSLASLKTFSSGLDGWKPEELFCSQREQERRGRGGIFLESSSWQLNGNATTEVQAEAATPVSPVLPRRLITVFGLESSGTTFVAKTLASIGGVMFREGSQHQNQLFENRSLEVSHISQPWGWHCETNIRPSVIPALYPATCGESMSKQGKLRSRSRTSFDPSPDVLGPVSRECRDLGAVDDRYPEKSFTYPVRYFVNITSHVEWYRSRGVDATAVIVLRDKSIGHYSRYLEHCGIEGEVEEDEKVGLGLIEEALERLPAMYSDSSSPPVVMVQYESLLLLGEFFLIRLLRELRLPTNGNKLPVFKNGNAKYIKEFSMLHKEKQTSRTAFSRQRHTGLLGKRLRKGTTLEDSLIDPKTMPTSDNQGLTTGK